MFSFSGEIRQSFNLIFRLFPQNYLCLLIGTFKIFIDIRPRLYFWTIYNKEMRLAFEVLCTIWSSLTKCLNVSWRWLWIDHFITIKAINSELNLQINWEKIINSTHIIYINISLTQKNDAGHIFGKDDRRKMGKYTE